MIVMIAAKAIIPSAKASPPQNRRSRGKSGNHMCYRPQVDQWSPVQHPATPTNVEPGRDRRTTGLKWSAERIRCYENIDS